MEYSTRQNIKACDCIDFSNTKYGGHGVYVYIWLDENGKPFYVGSGRGNRAASVSRREDQFKSKLNKNCSLMFIAKGLHRLGGLSFEYSLVRLLREKGYCLLNVAYNNERKHGGWVMNDIVHKYCSSIVESLF